MRPGRVDSFILVLRGWRLLAASLSPDEWRDVLATTGNKLQYLAISDEQFGGGGRAHQAVYVQHWHEEHPRYEQQYGWQDSGDSAWDAIADSRLSPRHGLAI